ncbi:hypothetical protein [Streptomyces sp. NBC_00572]|uniref:hypothetical protein n=1 Tax=Streptomyces sp. NBC_00572 TaxID=2903664 RepID=UPI00225029DA|nr:hypothetical protein [Streptomyces sp. NBC_00572]MCX4986239.1 hypothetical protein [Streptomyces sp. NBC_00572]
MAGIAHRWTARIAGAAATAALIFGSTTGTAGAVTNPPTFDLGANYSVIATAHPDTVGCVGYKVTGTGTVVGKPVAAGSTWTQDEVACTATVPGQYDITGTATITESDGDKLFLSYHLTAPLTSDTMVYPSGTFTITRGEGSFEEATGGGKMNAQVNLLDHEHVSNTLSGYIRYRWQI